MGNDSYSCKTGETPDEDLEIPAAGNGRKEEEDMSTDNISHGKSLNLNCLINR